MRSNFDTVINEADDTFEIEWKNTLFFLATNLGISDLITATKNEVSFSETSIILNRTDLTVVEYHTTTLDEAELKSRSYFRCEVEEPGKLLSDHLRLKKLWGEYFTDKRKKSDF